jgi:NCS1 family nucleobase:cation symporter-1
MTKQMNELVKQSADGRVELIDPAGIRDSPLYNHDLAPVPIASRSWNSYNFAALWMSMSACITTYMLASGLIAKHMSWWQALLTIFLGNVIVLIPILLNSHPGTKYGIPFPVFARAAYGTYGSNLPALMRALVACGWFGIQAWIGGQALDLLFGVIIPGWKNLSSDVGGHPLSAWLSFGLFWTLNIAVVFRGMELMKKLASLAAPFVFLMTAALAVWSVNKAAGLGHILSQPAELNDLASFMPLFIPSLTAMIGYWATLSLNMPDFTRFGQSQKEQTIGQVVALPSAMTVYSGMGVLITSAALIIFPNVSPEILWDPVKLVGQFEEKWIVAVAMFTIVLACLCVNAAANVVSPANDFANAFPRFITFSRGALITGIVGICMQPWRLLSDASAYIFTWLQGYSGGLGSIAGVLIVDYWIIRKKQLDLPDLYLEEGSYTYKGGWNWKAVVATLIGCFFAWIGAFVSALSTIYEYAWFVGLGVSGLVYFVLMSSGNGSPESAPDGQ